MSEASLIPVRRIEHKILLLRGEKVMLDSDLAELYGVETKVLNQAVQRNLERFPEDFMFRLSAEEAQLALRSQIVTSSDQSSEKPPQNTANLRSQIVTSSSRYGGRRYLPYAFTEQGVAMLSGVLASPRAVQVNIAIIRTFVQLRRMLSSHADLARRLAVLEGKYDKQFRVIFDVIRELMSEKKIRHLPVMESEKLAGVISIGDVVKELIASKESTISNLENYIEGRGYGQ